MLRPPPGTTLFPYTTLFRSEARRDRHRHARRGVEAVADARQPGREHVVDPEPEGEDSGRDEREHDHRVGEHWAAAEGDRKSTRLNSSHPSISYAVFCLKKKK